MRPSRALWVSWVLGFVTLTACGEGAGKVAGDAAIDVPASDAGVDGASDGGDTSEVGSVMSPLPFSPSNIEPTGLVWAGVQDVVITGACRIDGELGRIECGSSPIAARFAYARQIQPGAGALGVFAMKSLRIEAGASLQVMGGLPVVLVAAERIDVLGSLLASGKKGDAIAGGFPPFARNPAGAGPGGGASGAPGYHGGGGGSHCGLGGVGAADIADMPAFPGAHAGAKYGNAELIPLWGGSSGGGSARDATGGSGGGALQLVAGIEIAIGATGVVSVSGGGARPGGGGGSGGAVLIEAPKVSVLGALAANGGGGGIFAGGAGGQDGTSTTTPASGETATTAGGGSAGMVLDGSAGLSTTTNATSGGGGGAGRFRINTADGQATLGDKLSPAAGTACVTVGSLRPVTTAAGVPLPSNPTIGFKPSNVDLTALAAMAVEDIVLTNHCEIDTDTGKFQCGNSQPVTRKFAFAQAPQTGAGRVGVFYARSLRIEPGAELEVRGKLPLVFATPGPIAVQGAVSGRAIGKEAWAGGFAAADTNGTGLGGGGAGAGAYQGGGGGGFCGAGGPGAGAAAAAGGKPAGTADLIPLLAGSSGGGNGGPGGAGGGAIHLVSGTGLEIGLGGLIDVAGGGRSTGSGGGSGGAILLEAPALSSRGVLAANGGGGGVFAGGPGGDDGRSRAEVAYGELPNTGGQGSAGDTKDGQAGLSVTTNNTSGGGGGAGRIRINTATGAAALEGVNSPSAPTGCFTIGKIP
ncbi:MAG TPA: hypothetical protein VGG33_08445 [Polyangia bacterium]